MPLPPGGLPGPRLGRQTEGVVASGPILWAGAPRHAVGTVRTRAAPEEPLRIAQARASGFEADFFSTRASSFLESAFSSRFSALIWLWVATPAAWIMRLWIDSALF